MIDTHGHTPETIGLFLFANAVHFLSIPIVSDVIPMLSIFMMYLINKDKVDKAWQDIKAFFKSLRKDG